MRGSATTGDPVLDATNEIIAEVDSQLKGGGVHLTVLAFRIVSILDKHKRALRQGASPRRPLKP